LAVSAPTTAPATAPARPHRPTPLGVAKRTWAAWKRLSPFFGASGGLLVVSAAGSIVAGLVEAVLLGLIAALAQALSSGRETVSASLGPLHLHEPLGPLIVVGLVLALVRAVVQLVLAYLPARLSTTVNSSLRRRMLDGFTGTSWSVQSAERDGHFQSLIGGHVTNASAAVQTLSSVITSTLMFLTLLATAFVISIWTALLLMVVSVFLFFLLQPFSVRLRRYSKELSAENVGFSQGVQEVVLMAEEIQVFGASGKYRATMDELIEKVRVPLLRSRFFARAVPSLYQSMALLFLVLALAVLHWVGATGIAQLGAVVLILIRSLTFGQQIQNGLTNLDAALPFMHRLRDTLDTYEANPRQDGDEPLPSVQSLAMRHVDFSYSGGDDVLHDVSFEVRRGQALGIVGPSGAGKSSIVQILLRLRLPGSGALEVNGVDAQRFQREDWQRRVAYVPQTPQLIHGSVADNIRFYREGITDEEVESAARRAHIHDDVVSWAQGYDTLVGQRASAVSGGQRQRLTLARALAGRPDVLILDEPTSALDVKSEQLVQDSLEELRGDLILILVAHRLSTLSVCDRVMVVVGGHVQAIDAPEALMDTNAFFREVTEITRQQRVAP
jgi:ATP-binding cassette, subfamily B, bacterial